MCGIVGYVGSGLSRNYVFKGLSRLEYRGYDSAGFACINKDDGHISYHKASGHLDCLERQIEERPIDGHVGIGHIRWSSHGVVSLANAHPHFDCTQSISLVHNGIIENDYAIRQKLQKLGHTFSSQTDTEVVAHLLEEILLQEKDLVRTLIRVTQDLQGAYAIACITQSYPDQLIVIRKGSPLCVGFGIDEVFVASDQIAFAEQAREVVFLPDESFALISFKQCDLYNFDGEPLLVKPQPMDKNILSWLSEGKEGYAHFMLKEIYEQKGAITKLVRAYQEHGSDLKQQLGLSSEQLLGIQSITLIGSGTSWHAAQVAQYFFEEITQLPTSVHLASEFRYRRFFPQSNSLYIFVSQSGETADTLESLRLANSFNCYTIALTNVKTSSAVREAKGHLLTYAGQEVAVASTKTFSSQIASLFWLAHYIRKQQPASSHTLNTVQSDLLLCAEVLENTIECYKEKIVRDLAPFYSAYEKFIFLGRHHEYPLAMEAALKLKEISYLFAQSYPAGELKHGSLALIDETIITVVFSSLNPLIYQKLLTNVQEVKARHGHVLVFGFQDQDELLALADNAFILPRVNELLAPLAMTGIMQFFVYQIAYNLNRPIDKPRNLAKTLTIE